MITVVSWKWRQGGTPRVFLPDYVNRHRSMVSRHLKQEHRYICVTDDPAGVDCETFPLWGDHDGVDNISGSHFPSCYRRLKLFDPATTEAMGIAEGDRVVSMDLDVVLVGDLDPLFDRPENFVGWYVTGGRHVRVYNGTLFMLRAATISKVWTDFNPKKSPWEARRAGYFGSDQGWLSYRLIEDGAGWTREDGILGYNQDCRLTGIVPPHTRLVSFHGSSRKPWDKNVQAESSWVRDCWR